MLAFILAFRVKLDWLGAACREVLGFLSRMGPPFYITWFDKTSRPAPARARADSVLFFSSLGIVARFAASRWAALLRLLGRQGLPVFAIGTLLSLALQTVKVAVPQDPVTDGLMLGAGVLLAAGARLWSDSDRRTEPRRARFRFLLISQAFSKGRTTSLAPSTAAEPNAETSPFRAPEFAVVVPTFNERVNLDELYRRLSIAPAGLNWEVIVVDDNSPDGTADAAWELGRRHANLRCIKRVAGAGWTRPVPRASSRPMPPMSPSWTGTCSMTRPCRPRCWPQVRAGADIVVGTRYSGDGSAGDGFFGLSGPGAAGSPPAFRP